MPEEPTEEDLALVPELVDVIWHFSNIFSGMRMYPYQEEFGRRMIESLITNDGDELTALFARQMGKTEVVANVVCSLMVLLPLLAGIPIYSHLLAKFSRGLLVGTFAPVKEQAKTLYERINDRLTSPRAEKILADPEINDVVEEKGSVRQLRRLRSLVRVMTAHPKAQIESKTYHLIIMDEAQKCFPAGTKVRTTEGDVPIEKIVEGGRRDWTIAVHDGENKLAWARVSTAYRSPRTVPFVRVVHERGSVIATANHPFLVEGCRVAAGDLRPGQALSVVSNPLEPGESETAHMQLLAPKQLDGLHGRGTGPNGCSRQVSGGAKTRKTQPSSLNTYGPEQPNVVGAVEAEDARFLVAAGSSSPRSGRERSRSDEATADLAGRSWTDVAPRVCYPYWRSDQGWPSNSLQGRSGPSRLDEGGGGGWSQPSGIGAEGSGSTQGSVVVESRVVSVEVLQPDDPDIARLGVKADWVYTLGVDHEAHNYFAEGVLVGNCDERMWSKSISPMAAAVNGTKVMLGTPDVVKGVFYKTIRRNQREQTQRGGRRNHFQFDWKVGARYNPFYAKYVEKERRRLTEESDEFRLAYRLEWILERGMFIVSTRMEELGDKRMTRVKTWAGSTLIGVDPARKVDSTVVTAVWVDWNRPNENGLCHHRILDWLEMPGEGWEEQYFRIVDFISRYNVYAVGVDGGGMGDTVADRLQHLLPSEIPVEPLSSSPQAQSSRWKYLTELLTGSHDHYGSLFAYPAHPNARRTKTWQRFVQQMTDLEKKYQGPYMLAEAPKENGAHDDFCLDEETPLLIRRNGGESLLRLGNVVPGDLVRTHHGRWMPVEAVSRREATSIKVDLWGAPSLVATPEHPVLTQRGFTPVKDLRSDDQVLYRLADHGDVVPPSVDMLQFFDTSPGRRNNANIDLQEVVTEGGTVRYRNPKARSIDRFVSWNEDLYTLLGHYAADGSTGRHNVQWTVSEAKGWSETVVGLVASCFGTSKDGISNRLQEGRACRNVSVSSKPLREFFRHYMGGTASEKHLPVEVMDAPDHLKQAFLRGYLRGDGGHHRKDHWNAATTSPHLMAQIRDLLLSQGVFATVAVNRNHDLWTLKVDQASSLQRLSSLMVGEGYAAADGELGRTRREAVLDREFLRCFVRGIEPAGRRIVVNLRIAGDHSYTTLAGTSHNCDSLALACILSKDFSMPEVEVAENVLMRR